MEIVTQPTHEVKVCFNPELINGILEKIDKDPEIAPKGLAQINFFHHLVTILQCNGELMDVVVERKVGIPNSSDAMDDTVMVGAQSPREGETVWSAENSEEETSGNDGENQT